MNANVRRVTRVGTARTFANEVDMESVALIVAIAFIRNQTDAILSPESASANPDIKVNILNYDNSSGYRVKLNFNDHGYNEFPFLTYKILFHFWSKKTR